MASQMAILYYQIGVGSLMYAMTQTWLDLAFAMSSLSPYCHNPSAIHNDQEKRRLRYYWGGKGLALILGGHRDRGDDERGSYQLITGSVKSPYQI
ncbi:hypothetical protein M431DRAFT_172934 [Trichoderma harzianum CBS 226.95]|uniref:Uncharacterized protein n=1 Tax=Trichoderma harzianum CBS 226.95 TaxID=983964 RepID=A0A2T4ASW9_TRIHA|nr:hypothetical protein M431DRAFT_172934 [Trichoderma harzianum CBS 226.95]PTB60151.1 hypothetical protein M431DRAFT_172934 [Trichoderma harzianum CBS 226.95]